MTGNDHRLDELGLAANGRVNGNQQRRIDRGAVERAAADLLRALGADVDARRSRKRPAGWPTRMPSY